MERKTTRPSSALTGPGVVDLPKTMRALGVRKYTQMSGLEVLEVPVPEIKEPKQMLIKMHAAGFASGEANIIAGRMKMLRDVIVAIAALFPAELFRAVLGDDNVLPFWFLWIAALAQLYYRWRLRGTSIQRGVISGNAGAREDVEPVGEILATGKIQPVMTVVEMEDIEAVREAADKVLKIKGGVGGLVIKIA
ncbi:GroES-like protein [Apiospora phragmitis]|uniref:GroES-like protein n=1 Tax=Apiospora phragmitis TaxID=2905665 RepID=A0ABR1UR78_9PEZI